ncbi:hypothetical protein A7X92_03750 [Stenotrophomonas maltophilia]|nr:hypothetical protein A7X92_03750 [Stenotrophomonas maltophilia]
MVRSPSTHSTLLTGASFRISLTARCRTPWFSGWSAAFTAGGEGGEGESLVADRQQEATAQSMIIPTISVPQP